VIGQFEGKVALVTGAARGQGRSHALRFAEEGADILAVDVCAQIGGGQDGTARPEEFDETVNLVKKSGRRIVAEYADVRDFWRLTDIVARGMSEFGRIDFVLANAGVAPGVGGAHPDISAYLDAVNVMLNGVYFTVEAAVPALLSHGDGGAVVITSSPAGFSPLDANVAMRNHARAGFIAAKHGVIGLMRYFATSLAGHNIRVNTVHPTGVANPMVEKNELDRHAGEHPILLEQSRHLEPVQLLEPADLSDAIVFLCGAPGKSITGVTVQVDAGRVDK
jgi:NAD(P)-dependent dehydrogenase (short-subunit alcohol dehydrogenase family)